MSGARPVLYFDLGSPYGYLAVERAPEVLGVEPELEPVLLGAIFRHRGWGSWSATSERAPRIAELERRAAAYGLPLAWPRHWPPDGLAAQRAATYAKTQGRTREFALAAYRAGFVDGADVTDVEVLLRAGERAGLERAALAAALGDPEIKQALRAATDAAIAAGVVGVPSIRVGDAVLWGDDRLEEAAALLRAA